MIQIKAILFDMDGVLIDARMWHFEALNRALKLFGMDISMHEHLSKFDGLPTKVKLELLSSEAGLPRGLHQFINELKQTYTVEMGYLHCRPNFYHQYALAKLSADGYKMAVCSNSIKKTIDFLLSRAEIKDFLTYIYPAKMSRCLSPALRSMFWQCQGLR